MCAWIGGCAVHALLGWLIGGIGRPLLAADPPPLQSQRVLFGATPRVEVVIRVFYVIPSIESQYSHPFKLKVRERGFRR